MCVVAVAVATPCLCRKTPALYSRKTSFENVQSKASKRYTQQTAKQRKSVLSSMMVLDESLPCGQGRVGAFLCKKTGIALHEATNKTVSLLRLQ
jgi:hypothetical protein